MRLNFCDFGQIRKSQPLLPQTFLAFRHLGSTGPRQCMVRTFLSGRSFPGISWPFRAAFFIKKFIKIKAVCKKRSLAIGIG